MAVISYKTIKTFFGPPAVARNSYEVVRDRAGFSRKVFLAPKIGKMDPKWAKKQGFLNFLENLVINFY